MSRLIPVAGLLFFLLCLFGCGLFGGSKSYQFQEPREYTYKSERDEMIDHAKIYRQSALSSLERDATELESEKKREDEKAAKEKKKKKSWAESWFGQGNETFLMSDEAKRINSNFER